MECLQFGGNTEFWQSFESEKVILSYFKKCYHFAIRTIGYLHTDENILCACIIQEENRKNLFVYYLPITERWNVKVESNRLSEKGHRLQLRNEYDEPIYASQYNTRKPLLSHSEFWKQRGDMQSYSLLQENFFNQVSQVRLKTKHPVEKAIFLSHATANAKAERLSTRKFLSPPKLKN